MEPDRESWEYRLGAASHKAMWAIGVPRPIRLVLKWPLLALIVLAYLVTFPIRFLRYLIKPV